jgi:predicted MPP superfamily phosphohydrolase
VLLPDTQQYTKSCPQFFEAQTKWIAAQKTTRHVAYLIHMGDITEHEGPKEWDVAQRSLRLLGGHVPYVLVTGNHDYTGGGRQTRLHEYFPPTAFKPWPTFGGLYQDGRLENSYHLLTIGERP